MIAWPKMYVHSKKMPSLAEIVHGPWFVEDSLARLGKGPI